MSRFYTLIIYTLLVLMRLVSPFSKRIRSAFAVRKGQAQRLEELFAKFRAEDGDTPRPLIWFHAASLGEFEQGRPLIEAFRAAHPNYRVLLSFFSPSGYEIRKNYEGADVVCYLPLDTPAQVDRFLDTIQPQVAVFIKYEFWLNFLLGLRRRGVKSYLISAIFRPQQVFFRPWGGVMCRALHSFNHLFVQQGASAELLAQILPVAQVSVAGDTRFDRVASIAEGAKSLPVMERFAGDAPLLVAGSTWAPDEAMLLELIAAFPEVKFVVAPHEMEQERITAFAEVCGALRYTELTEQSDLEGTQVLVIDTIGILSSLYRYGRYGYIGGGFGVGIHNTLEAATFGLPLAFGPNYQRFAEACDLIEQGGARALSTAEELKQWFGELHGDEQRRQSASQVCKSYIATHRGATQMILSRIESEL